MPFSEWVAQVGGVHYGHGVCSSDGVAALRNISATICKLIAADRLPISSPLAPDVSR